jgi:hypothetical protein
MGIQEDQRWHDEACGKRDAGSGIILICIMGQPEGGKDGLAGEVLAEGIVLA